MSLMHFASHKNTLMAIGENPADDGLSVFPALSDVVFQLLIVFVIGAAGHVANLYSSSAKTPSMTGHRSPKIGKLVHVEVILETRPESDSELFSLKVTTAPSVADPTEISNLQLNQLIREINRLRESLSELAELEYDTQFSLVAPGTVRYIQVIEVLAQLENHTGNEWMIGAY